MPRLVGIEKGTARVDDALSRWDSGLFRLPTSSPLHNAAQLPAYGLEVIHHHQPCCLVAQDEAHDLLDLLAHLVQFVYPHLNGLA